MVGHPTLGRDPKGSWKERRRLGYSGCKVMTVNEITQDLWTGKENGKRKKYIYMEQAEEDKLM